MLSVIFVVCPTSFPLLNRACQTNFSLSARCAGRMKQGYGFRPPYILRDGCEVISMIFVH